MSTRDREKLKCAECEYWKDGVCVAYACVESGGKRQSLF
jgi:hypothetical protein